MLYVLRGLTRVLTGSHPGGDAYVLAALEATVADPAGFAEHCISSIRRAASSRAGSTKSAMPVAMAARGIDGYSASLGVNSQGRG